MMKLSNETLTVLKNFASINQGMQFKPGNVLSTMSGGKSVLAQASIKDSFPEEFCIYDLNQFLLIYNLNKDPELVFEDANIIFKCQDGRRNGIYRKTAKEMITVAPEKTLTLPSEDCSFTLTAEDYDYIMDSAKALSSPHIAVVSDGEKIELLAFDAKDDSAHIQNVEVGTGNGKKYSLAFKTENIKMIPGSYDVVISFKGFAHFKNTKEDIQYWVAFEAKDSKVPS